MEPWAKLTLRQNGLVTSIDLHCKLQCQGRVLQVLGCLLELLEVDGVIEGAHVQKHCDAVERGGSRPGSVIVHGWW